jgi:hypothetical protein
MRQRAVEGTEGQRGDKSWKGDRGSREDRGLLRKQRVIERIERRRGHREL